MSKWVVVALALLLAGCGKAPISEDEAASIAALSQDAGVHHSAFTKAIRELSTEDKCNPDVMRSNGGFTKVTGEYYYFIYCGEPMNSSRRWYINPRSEVLTRFSAEL